MKAVEMSYEFGSERSYQVTQKGATVTVSEDKKVISTAVFTGKRAASLARKYYDLLGILFD